MSSSAAWPCPEARGYASKQLLGVADLAPTAELLGIALPALGRFPTLLTGAQALRFPPGRPYVMTPFRPREGSEAWGALEVWAAAAPQLEYIRRLPTLDQYQRCEFHRDSG
jgi:hypothetical protein